MFALKVVIAAVFAVACNALALGDHSELITILVSLVTSLTEYAAELVERKPGGVACSFGQPINATTITLDNGAQVQSWGCKQSVAEKVKHAQDATDFKIGTYDSRGLSVEETSLTKRQYNACGINCTTYCKSPA